MVVDGTHLVEWEGIVDHIDIVVAVVVEKDPDRCLVVPGFDGFERWYLVGGRREVGALLDGKKVGELEGDSRCRWVRAPRLGLRLCLWIGCRCGLGFDRELPCLLKFRGIYGSCAFVSLFL